MGKKVSCIIPMLGSGGAERVMSYIANYLDEKGHEVIIYTLLNDEEAYSINSTVKHVHIDSTHKNKVLKQFKRIFNLRKKLKNDGSEVVISFDLYTGIPAALFLGKKVISSERNDPYSNIKKGSFWAHFRNYLYARVNTMVFQTEYAMGYFPKKVQNHGIIIPNPIPNNLPDRYEGERKKKIVAACRLHTQKNLPMMFACVTKILKKYPDYEFFLYGDGPRRAELLLHLSNCKQDIQDRFHLCGFVTDLPEKIIDAAMYISTSNFEGISNSMLEALALGIPTICTDCPAGGAAMAIQSGENGILVPVGDRVKMYEAMEYIINNPDKAEEMSIKAVEIREKWSTEKICSQWLNIVEN